MKFPVDTAILDAIATLLGISAGDVNLKIEEGEFEELAQEALCQFNRKYEETWDLWIDRKADTRPLADLIILEECLIDLEEKILFKIELFEKHKNPKVLKEVLDLDNIADDFRRRIDIERNKEKP